VDTNLKRVGFRGVSIVLGAEPGGPPKFVNPPK